MTALPMTNQSTPTSDGDIWTNFFTQMPASSFWIGCLKSLKRFKKFSSLQHRHIKAPSGAFVDFHLLFHMLFSWRTTYEMVEKIFGLVKRLSQMAYGKMPTGKFDSRVVIEIKNESLLNDDWIEIPESITYRVVDSKGKELIRSTSPKSYALVGSKLKGIQTKLKPKHLRLIFNALDFANIFSIFFCSTTIVAV